MNLPLCVPIPHHALPHALSERLALAHLRRLLGPSAVGAVPPALTMASFDDIVAFACQKLDSTARALFLNYVDGLLILVGQAVKVLMPPPLGNPGAESPRAEQLAWNALSQKDGHLWPLVREVVSQLPFEPDSRSFAQGQTLALGLYGKGGLLGFTRHTKQYGNVCRLLNQLVYTTWTAHKWTSLAIGVDNLTQPHVDKWNLDANALLVGLTHHTDGGLWIAGEGGTCYEECDNTFAAGRIFSTSGTGVLFNSRSCLHATQAWTGGNRIVLIAYSVSRAAHMSAELCSQLHELGFVPPTPSSEPDEL